MNQKLLKIQPADFFGPNHNIHSKVNRDKSYRKHISDSE